MDTFTFVDKDTGDVIQTGAPNDFSLNASQTRAIADFHAPVSIFHSFEPSLREESFGFEYAAVEPTGLKSDVKPAFEIEIETVSPCAKKPRVVAPTHFYVSHARYSVLKEDIDRSLQERCELVFSACPKKQMVSRRCRLKSLLRLLLILSRYVVEMQVSRRFADP